MSKTGRCFSRARVPEVWTSGKWVSYEGAWKEGLQHGRGILTDKRGMVRGPTRNDERWLGFSTRNTGGDCGERGHEICEICEKVMEEHTFF